MEKRLYKMPDLILCNCGNQVILVPGCRCDVCMGIAPESIEAAANGFQEKCDQFDQSYFEALERMFESFEFAA